MKHIVSAMLAAGALALGTAAASAADMPLKAPPVEIPFTWSGWYIGGNVGWMRGNTDFDPICTSFNAPDCPVVFPGFAFTTSVPGVPPFTTFVPAALGTIPGGSASDKSFMGGGQIGYNAQSGIVVWGGEADIDWTHIRAGLVRNAVPPPGTPPGFLGTVAVNSTFDNDWIGSVRGRLGLAWDRVMIYGTGGIAFAKTTVNTAFVSTPPANALPAFAQPGATGASSPQVIAGWTAGGGVEFFVWERVSVGAEYRHSDFGHQNYPLGFDIAGAPISTNVKYTTDQVTARANWHFDWR